MRRASVGWPCGEARGVELFAGDHAFHSASSQAVRGWEHLPLPNCRPPSSPEVGTVEGAEDPLPPTLAPQLYTALVRSVLLPWGTQPPGETSILRMTAAAALRDALGISVDQHAAALTAAHRANRDVVHKLNSMAGEADFGSGTQSDARSFNPHNEDDGDSDDDGDLTAAFRLEEEKRALEPLVSDLRSLPRFDVTVHVTILKAEGQPPPKTCPAPRPEHRPSSRLGQKLSVGAGDVTPTAAGGVKAEDVALVGEEDKVKGAGGIFACCFGRGVGKAKRARRVGGSRPFDNDEHSAMDATPAQATEADVDLIEDRNGDESQASETGIWTETPVATVTATEPTATEGHLYCTVSMMSRAGPTTGSETTSHWGTHHSTPVPCTVQGDTILHALTPQMRVSCDDAATALIEVRLYWGREVEAVPELEPESDAEAENGDGSRCAVSKRLAVAVGGDGLAQFMRAGDMRGQRIGVLLGVASLRVADLEDTSESTAPRVERLMLRDIATGCTAGAQGALPILPKLTAVHIAVDCFMEELSGTDEGVNGPEEACTSGGTEHWAGDNLAESCVAVASALWAGWERAGCRDSGGPLDTSLRAGMHIPTWPDHNVCEIADSARLDAPWRQVIPPRGWRGVLCAFSALHRVPRATVALAEAEAIARRWRARPEITVVSELHARLATAVSAIASGRATLADVALHEKVATLVLPHAESSLHKLLAPPRGTNAGEAATTLRALTPVLALCLPLDTSATKFANYLHRAARRAVTARVARDLATPLASEAKAAAEAAGAAAVARTGAAGIQKDDESEYDARSYRSAAGDVSETAVSQIGTEAGRAAATKASVCVSMSTATVAAASNSKFVMLLRVVSAAETAVACFPTDLTVFRALPSGVSAAPVALHSTAAALMRAAAEATAAAAGSVWVPSYGAAFVALDVALRDLRLIMHATGLGSAAGPLAAYALDSLLRPSLEELLASIRPRLASVLLKGVARERSPTLPPTPVAPARGAMHSASLVDLFAALRDTYVMLMPGSVCSRRRARHLSVEVEIIIGAALRWYASEHERNCLDEVHKARKRLWGSQAGSRFAVDQQSGGKDVCEDGRHREEGSGGSIMKDREHGGTPAALTFGFQTRLSNIHACVASLHALREDCPLLWRLGGSEFAATSIGSGIGADDVSNDEYDDESNEESKDAGKYETDYGDQIRDDDMMNNTGSARRPIAGADGGNITESTSFVELLRSLRCSRASVISAATELLMDFLTPDLTLAVLSPDLKTRRAATSRAFEYIDAELSRMESALAAGAFRLAATAVHRGACAVLERLVLHCAHDDVHNRASVGATLMASHTASGGWLAGTAAPLTEVQHSRVVELAAALRDFLLVGGGGVPAQVLTEGEQRLRRLLNLWFTPTLEVVREYWRQVDAVDAAGGGATAATADRTGAMGVVRPAEGGSVGPLDLIQLLAQRGAMPGDGAAKLVVDAQLSTAAGVNAQTVLRLPLGEFVAASFVCRLQRTTLAGRLFVMSSCVGFSSCGVGPDHPHDMHSAVTALFNHVVRAFKGDADSSGLASSASLHLLLVDSTELVFDCFSGGARVRDLAFEALRASATASHPEAPFIAAAATVSLPSMRNPDLAWNSRSVVVLPPGETMRRKFACTLHALQDEKGTLHVTSAALLWLPSEEARADSSSTGRRIRFEEIDLAAVAMSRLGWTDHAVTVRLRSRPGVEAHPIRFIRLTESGARALQGELRAAATVPFVD